MINTATLKQKVFETKMAAFDRRASRGCSENLAVEKMSADELSSVNWARRKSLVEHCAAKIPFYRASFKDIGFEPGDLRDESDWKRLPILEKEDIRENEAFLHDRAFRLNQLPVSTTGGTTGQPLKTYLDPRIHLASLSWRMMRWWGVLPSDNAGYLYRAVPTGGSRWVKDIALYPTKRAYISATAMSQENMRKFALRLSSIEPTYLVGYVGALEVFAAYCEANGHKFPSLKAVWTTASPLTENQRAEFDRVFEAQTYTQYGSCEFYWISAECRHRSGLHIGTDCRHVDVLDDAPNPSTDGFGDLLISDLQNYSFPLLRYRVGDRGRLLSQPCQCGLPFPMMDYVRGRISDNLTLEDGTTVPGEFWTTIFDDFTDTIASFQVRQAADLGITISYVPLDKNGQRDAETVMARLRHQFSGHNAFAMCPVKEIDQISGKIQIVIKDRADHKR